jgi:hypothetical protein
MKTSLIKLTLLLVITGSIFTGCNKGGSQKSTSESVVSEWVMPDVGNSYEKTYNVSTETATYKLVFENRSLCPNHANRVIVKIDNNTVLDQVYQHGSVIERLFTVSPDSEFSIKTLLVDGDSNIVCVWAGTSSFKLYRVY